ncbi:hypothetical protein CAF53_18410 [Sphingobium sp. LB126]|uniref:Uncharacterized protein n=1 Tax=Sphingobium chungbukense TaxID=56193 RepID=A0A0M3ASR3_9SPHN|nr:hypothetical protein YP76_12940 [Sphingobium chungbukense]PJG46181.1 hypothetical protein CAF53_18410 [Sphingobium sp. LB126]
MPDARRVTLTVEMQGMRTGGALEKARGGPAGSAPRQNGRSRALCFLVIASCAKPDCAHDAPDWDTAFEGA